MDLLESLARRRIQQSEEKIRDALILAAIGNPFAAETNARRLQERFQAKVGLTPRAAEATAAQVVETARQARAQHEAFTQGARPIAEAAAAATRPDRREKIWGDTIDFVSVSFLERGAQTARSVGRVAYARVLRPGLCSLYVASNIGRVE